MGLTALCPPPRFFSQPDFDGSFKAWAKLQSLDHISDTLPEAVETWMTTGLPWESKKDEKEVWHMGMLTVFGL